MEKKILIVEDECITSFELETKIQNWGYSIVGIATAGSEAFEMTIELQPDLIIMDIRLNGVEDGVDVMEKIQNNTEIPFIYLTAHSSDSIMNRAHKTDPYAYIIKPFDDMELKFALELAFYKHDLEKKLKESDKKFRDVMDNLMTGIFIADIDGNMIFNNRFLDDIFSDGSLNNESKTNEKKEFQKNIKTKSFLETLTKEGYIQNQTFKIDQINNSRITMLLSAKLKDNRIYGVVTLQF
nr:response regulator [uncultured Methanobacterium sp.]